MHQLHRRTYPMTQAEFLEWEDSVPERHEYIGGVITMMAGGRLSHNVISGNVYSLLKAAFRPKKCQVFIENAKLTCPNGDVTYPDISVVCRGLDLRQSWMDEPVILVEVLSSSTEQRDRGVKWLSYQAIPSLQHYLLINQDTPRIDHYARSGNGWVYSVAEGLTGSVLLDPYDGVALTLAEVYEDAEPEV